MWELNHRNPAIRSLSVTWRVEVDELWSFVGKKANPQWLWLALDARSCQVLAFHVGDRSRKKRAAVME